MQKLSDFFDIPRNLVNEIYVCTSITINGTRYVSNECFLAVDHDDGGLMPGFGKLKKIYVVNSNLTIMEVSMFDTDRFEESTQSYIVKEPDMPSGNVVCRFNDLVDHTC